MHFLWLYSMGATVPFYAFRAGGNEWCAPGEKRDGYGIIEKKWLLLQCGVVGYAGLGINNIGVVAVMEGTQHERIVLLDFGSQYTQLIARRVRELGVYCEVLDWTRAAQIDVKNPLLRGVILSGSPSSVNSGYSLRFDLRELVGEVPMLGICFGAQLLAREFGGEVVTSGIREYGRANLSSVDADTPLLQGVKVGSRVWMSHGDTIVRLPEGWCVTASTESVEVVAFEVKCGSGAPVFGVQFHPEVSHSEDGFNILRNFVIGTCGCACDWTPAAFVQESVQRLRDEIGGDGVVLALSGGVDSTVAAAILHRAIGDQLTCIFVDHGLLRAGEYEEVLTAYRAMGLKVEGVDASERFFTALKGITDPEAKRKAVGRCFIEEFDQAAGALKNVKWLGQGTIYPDVIESSPVGPDGKRSSVMIKSHHNVGGLPKEMRLRVVEPLRYLFKDEVRRVGESLGIPRIILGRHPFPGPGLAIRVLGEVTRERVAILQAADRIFISELKARGLYDSIWQAGAILLPVRTVGVMGDERTYESVVALRAVESVDGMTADWYPMPYDALQAISTKIINGVRGVNRVVYDVSSKPPSTIEWE